MPKPPSDNLPSGLRLAQRGDEAKLYDIFHIAYRENGFGDFHEATVRDVINKICRGETYAAGIIDGAERIEAVLGLQPACMWYGKSWYWNELLFYVHPEHRKSHHAVKLFLFARWWEREMGTPVVIGVFPTQRLAEKLHLFERFAKPAGGIYLVGDGEWRNLKRAS